MCVCGHGGLVQECGYVGRVGGSRKWGSLWGGGERKREGRKPEGKDNSEAGVLG